MLAAAAAPRTTWRFTDIAFRAVPLTAMAALAAVACACGSGWTEYAAPLPWLVSLGFVGLPHGAADFASSRSHWRGWTLVAVWLAYASAMAAVAIGFVAAPRVAIVAFAALSSWHFGMADLDAEHRAAVSPRRSWAPLARGCVVLAMPLAVWPEATARVASELAALAVGDTAAARLFPPRAVGAAGMVLAAVTLAAAAAEAASSARRPWRPRAWLGLMVEIVVISALGWCVDPLFSVGCFFLAWHAWRQMEPLAKTLTGSAPRSWLQLALSLVRVHIAALPLLVPSWAAIGTTWWLWAPGHTPKGLAIVSIGAYLVATPAHELLGVAMRRRTGRRAAQPARSGQAVWASSRNTPMRRNLS